MLHTQAVPAQMAESLGQLKKLLKQAAVQVNTSGLQRPPLVGIFHLLYTKPGKGLVMHELAGLAAADELNYLSSMGIEQLDEHLFRQVNKDR